MRTKEMYDEMKSSLACDLFELIDDYDEDGDRITIFKDEMVNGMYIVNVETNSPSDFRYCGSGVKSKTELLNMSEEEFRRMINSIYYYAQPVN